MTHRASAAQSGFTLLEALVALVLFLFTVMTITLALDSNRRAYVRGEVKMDVQQNARVALGTLTTEVRVAGYFPENFALPAADPPLADPVQIATDEALVVHGDLDGSGASSVFLYCLDGTTLRRGRAAAGDATAYWCPAGEALAENVTSLRFDYFDEDNATVPANATPPFALDGQPSGAVPDFDDVTERSAVRRVVMTLTVADDVPGLEPQVFRLGSDVRLRNVR
jgi:Tfp pilus assembly protein PilW